MLDNLLVVEEEGNSVPSSVPSLRPPSREQILVHVYSVLEIPAQAAEVLSRRGVTSVRSLMQLQRIQLECFRNEEPQNLPIVHVESIILFKKWMKKYGKQHDGNFPSVHEWQIEFIQQEIEKVAMAQDHSDFGLCQSSINGDGGFPPLSPFGTPGRIRINLLHRLQPL